MWRTNIIDIREGYMRRISICICILSLITIIGCTQEKSQPVQAQSQQQVQSQATAPPVRQEFTFRGIKFGIPIEQLFKKCTVTEKSGCGDDYRGECGVKYYPTSEKEMCWSEYGRSNWTALFGIANFDDDTFFKKTYYVLGEKKRPYIIRNISPLESISSDEYVGLIDGKIESVAMEFGRGDALKVLEVIKAKYGPPTESNSVPIKDGVQVFLKWTTQEGYLIDLRTYGKSDDGSGTIVVKSPLYLKKQQEFLKGQI